MSKNRTSNMFVLALFICLPIAAYSQCLTENDNVVTKDEVTTDLSGITDFSLELFREVFPYNSSQNFFFSPYSIWSTLTLAYFGSQGHTETQLRKVLRTVDKVSAMKQWRQLQFMYEMRQINNTKYSFNVASKAYFDESINIKKCMKDILQKEIENVNFRQPNEAAQKINSFVSNVTKARITNIVSPGDIDSTKMALVNAAFFKGTWLYQFKQSRTKKELFYATPENYYFVDMMHQKGNFRSGPSEKLGAHILELPYSGEDISMVILLPPFITGETGFNEMVQKLNGTVLHDALNDLWRAQVDVAIPKFKLEEKIGDELIMSLKKMGITDLFDSARANMTAFAPDVDLSVGKSIHKAFVKVSEEGTEAAAATALIQFRVARPFQPEKFTCNHPFLFLIFDNVSQNILFMGAYKNPAA